MTPNLRRVWAAIVALEAVAVETRPETSPPAAPKPQGSRRAPRRTKSSAVEESRQ